MPSLASAKDLIIDETIQNGIYTYGLNHKSQKAIIKHVADTAGIITVNASTMRYSIDLEIPASIKFSDKKYQIVGIKSEAFKETTHIEKVILPYTITDLEDNVFKGSEVTELELWKMPSTIAVKAPVIMGLENNASYNLDFIESTGLKEGPDGYAIIRCPSRKIIDIERSIGYLSENIKFLPNERNFVHVDKNWERLCFKLDTIIPGGAKVVFNNRTIEPNDNKEYVISGEGYNPGEEIRVEFVNNRLTQAVFFLVPNYTENGIAYSFSNDDQNVATVVKNTILTCDTVREQSISIPKLIKYNGIEYTVKKIDGTAFKNSRKWRSIEIPASVDSISPNAFSTSRLSSRGWLYVVINKKYNVTFLNPFAATIYVADSKIINEYYREKINLHFSPKEIWPDCLFDTGLNRNGGVLSFKFAQHPEDIRVSYNGISFHPDEDGYYNVRGDECYPGNEFPIEFTYGNQTKKVSILMHNNYAFTLDTDEELIGSTYLGLYLNLGNPDNGVHNPDNVGFWIYENIDEKPIKDINIEFNEYVDSNDFDSKIIWIDGLFPNTTYSIVPYVIFNGHKISLSDIIDTPWLITTKSIDLNLKLIKKRATELQLTVNISYNTPSKEFAHPEHLDSYKLGVITIDGKRFSADGNIVTIKDLEPFRTYEFAPYIISNNKEFTPKIYYDFTTEPYVSCFVSDRNSPTTRIIWAINHEKDWKPSMTSLSLNGEETEFNGDKITLRGLKPSTSYFGSVMSYGDKFDYIRNGFNFTTSKLELKALPAKATSNTCAILMAETNIDSSETGCGFEWIRYDAPPEMPSNFSPCIASNGILAGKLEGLRSDTYYKFRPYYQDAEGNYYYGNDGKWTAFITEDAYVYFEPMIYTLETEAINDTNATVVGYVLEGSDKINEQGIEYWESNRNDIQKSTVNYSENEVYRVSGDGQMMRVTLNNLKSGTEYTYRTYALTDSEIRYGEERTFKTTGSSSTTDVEYIYAEPEPVAYYTLQGSKITNPQSGIYIVVYSDNSVKKIFIR